MNKDHFVVEFMNDGVIVQTKNVARWDLVQKVVNKLLPHPMFTAVSIKRVNGNKLRRNR